MWNEPPNSFTFCDENASPEDVELFLGPDPEEKTTFIRFGEDFTMADVAVATGKFPSKSQARKNGWDGDIPTGFTEKTLGKNAKKVHIWIFKKFD